MTLRAASEEQARLAQALLAPEVDDASWAALGGEPTRWQVYRRLVRGRVRQTVEHALPMFSSAIGASSFAALLDLFLARGVPRSPYLRDLPGELLAWLDGDDAAIDQGRQWPEFAHDLARYEWAELDVAYDAAPAPAPIATLSMDGVAVLQPAHRLLDLGYPVHRVETEAELAALAHEPITLCLFRDQATHEVQTLELTPIAATMLRSIDSGARLPLTQIVRNAAALHDVQVDVAFVGALSELLASLTERGLLLGSLNNSETS
jgi:hypothetical protein